MMMRWMVHDWLYDHIQRVVLPHVNDQLHPTYHGMLTGYIFRYARIKVRHLVAVTSVVARVVSWEQQRSRNGTTQVDGRTTTLTGKTLKKVV